MQWRGFGPAVDTLFPGDRFHNRTQEVASVVAILHHTLVDILGLKSSALKQFAGIVRVQQCPAITPVGKIAESQAEEIEGVTLGMIDGEASCREQRVIKEFCA